VQAGVGDGLGDGLGGKIRAGAIVDLAHVGDPEADDRGGRRHHALLSR
jgi:hypothetical protein